MDSRTSLTPEVGGIPCSFISRVPILRLNHTSVNAIMKHVRKLGMCLSQSASRIDVTRKSCLHKTTFKGMFRHVQHFEEHEELWGNETPVLTEPCTEVIRLLCPGVEI
jgi:hypothetical protein